jgi:hypothetical protein
MLNACGRSAYAEYSYSVCVYIYIYYYYLSPRVMELLVHHLNQTTNRAWVPPRPPHVSCAPPPGPGLFMSDHLHRSPILHAHFVDCFTLSSHTAALPHALLLLRSRPSPATNDLNATLRALAASSNPARSLILLTGRLLPMPAPTPRCAQGPRPLPSAATCNPRSRSTCWSSASAWPQTSA